jgi:hypothetical protein
LRQDKSQSTSQAIRLECNICHSIPQVITPGKTIIIASTEGNFRLPEREEVVGLNVYRKK